VEGRKDRCGEVTGRAIVERKGSVGKKDSYVEGTLRKEERTVMEVTEGG
jgi:hypothetical protein